MLDYEHSRSRMVETQLAGRGIADERVLQAFRDVPRQEFVPPDLQREAYDDAPLPIGEGQTISQPYVVALMAQAAGIGPGDKVLDVGTGSGYAAAIAARLAARVYSIERHKPLADAAAERLARLGFANVEIRCGDGTQGWPQQAPFDAILVAAGSPVVPERLRGQLAIGGRLVVPVGDRHEQRMLVVTRTGEDDYEERSLGAVRFVPLVGPDGW